MDAAALPEPPGRLSDVQRQGLAVAVLALPALLVSLDLSVLLLAQPEISDDLGAAATEQFWITDAYGFMVAGFLVMFAGLALAIAALREVPASADADAPAAEPEPVAGHV